MASENRWGVIGVMAVLLWVGPLAARGQEAPAAPPSPEALLRQTSTELMKADTFQFHGEITFDDVLISGQKVQFGGAVDVTVRHPDAAYVDYRDDHSAKRFWYDGKTGTLLDLVQGVYSKAELPDDLDTAVAELRKQYDLSLPLANLISNDLFATIDARALAWGYLGVHDVEGTPAHHIAIVGRDADLQLWIQKDGRPLPLKLVVTYKDIPMAPQYQAVLMDWELGEEVPADRFVPDLPEDAQQIEFLVAEGRR